MWVGTGAADQGVIAAVGIVGHGVGVPNKEVICSSAADQRVVAAAGIAAHGKSVTEKVVAPCRYRKSHPGWIGWRDELR
jgi:hypothetical protein